MKAGRGATERYVCLLIPEQLIMVCDAHLTRGVDFLDKPVPGEYSIGR